MYGGWYQLGLSGFFNFFAQRDVGERGKSAGLLFATLPLCSSNFLVCFKLLRITAISIYVPSNFLK